MMIQKGMIVLMLINKEEGREGMDGWMEEKVGIDTWHKHYPPMVIIGRFFWFTRLSIPI
jgi:hypothetical protein